MKAPGFDPAVGRLAARQLGLVSRAQAVGIGATPDIIDHRLATGRWVRVGAGVYRLAGVPVTWRQRGLAACLVAGPGAVVSHRSAAVLWGVSGFRPGPLEITVPAGASGRNTLATVHRTRYLPSGDCTRRDRVPVTRPLRVLLDLSRRVGPELLEEAADDMFCRRLASPAQLTRRLETPSPRRSTWGTSTLRAILGAWNADGMPANVAEMRLVRLLLAAGLGEPVRQHEIRRGDELVARVDLAYPSARLAIELDSFRWHSGRGPFRSDRVRGNRIAALGWWVLRATPEDATDGSDLVAAVSQILSEAA